MLSLCEQSNIPKAKWEKPIRLSADGIDIPAFKRLREIQLNINDFVRNANSLYLYSENVGNGKTSWSIKLMMSYFNSVWAGNAFRCRGLFINVSDFLSKNKQIISSYDPEFDAMRAKLKTVDLVVWDDIATSNLSEYDHQMLYTYINERCVSGKSNIFTGNLSESSLVKSVGVRLSSRIWNASEVICLREQDKRGNSYD
jgi:DNA replication protein DnaC